MSGFRWLLKNCYIVTILDAKLPSTITGVTAGTDLTGGGTSGTVTLNLDTTKVPLLAAANNFTANQTITGNLSATGTLSAASLAVTSNAQVANLNASLLQGLAPSAFAGTGANVFTGNQTIPGQGGVNALIGNVGCSSAAGISFLASNSCNNYAIAGTTTETVINRPSGGSIVFAEGNGSPQFAVLAGGNTEVLGGVFTSTPTATTGSTIAVTGSNPSTSGTGVAGVATATSGATTGVLGQSSSASGIAGVFNNTAGGQILSGKNNGSQIFSVSGAGLVSASGGLTLPVSGTGVTFPDGTKQTTAGKSGTVTSVGLSAPASDFVVTGSPVTSSGALNLAWNVAPTSANTANAIVKRDANGGFSVGYLNAQSGSNSPALFGGQGSLSGTGSGFQFYDIGVWGLAALQTANEHH